MTRTITPRTTHSIAYLLGVRATLPAGLLKHLLVLVFAHLLAPLLDYRAQSNSQCAFDPTVEVPAANHTVSSGGDVLHGRPRGAPPSHPQVPRERGPTAPRRVGGKDLSRLDLQALRRAGVPGPPLSAGVRRPGRGLLLSSGPLRGDGARRQRWARHGSGASGGDGYAAGVPVRERGAEATLAGAGHPGRAHR